jgi:phospholipase C
MSPMLSRRNFLQIVGASAIAAATPSVLLETRAAAALHPTGSNGIEHVVVLMMENRSFDHFLSWLPGADGKHDLTFVATDGNAYPNYPLAPDFQGCGYSDPDHSWEGFLVQNNYGALDGFLQRPTSPPGTPGVTVAAANTFPAGYYTNLNPDGSPKAQPDLPVIGALAQNYTVLDRYFASFAGETYPNRFYQHAAQTDRDHNDGTTLSTLPTIWDQLSPVPNTSGIPTGGYFFRDVPFLALWGLKYAPFWRPVYDTDASVITSVIGQELATLSFFDTVAAGALPNVSFIDPTFEDEGTGTSADDHPLADVRLGERFIADVYHALSDAGYLDNTVLMVTFDEWGGFYEHVPPPHVVDKTNPANVSHTGDTTTDGQTYPDYTQLGFRVPAIVVSNLAPAQIISAGPFEHTSTLALIESTFGLNSLTARDANTQNLDRVLLATPRRPVASGTVPTSGEVPGPVNGAAAICSVTSVQSVSPAPVTPGAATPEFPFAPALPIAGAAVGGMMLLGRRYREQQAANAPSLATDGATSPDWQSAPQPDRLD